MLTAFTLHAFTIIMMEIPFPELGQEWKLVNSKKHKADEKHICDYDFEIYEK